MWSTWEWAYFIILSLVVFLALQALWIWMVVDCAVNEEQSTRKVIWLVVIALTHWLGALIYFFARKLPRAKAAPRT